MNSKSEVRRRERLTFAQRLHHPKDFERVYAAQQSVRAPNLLVFVCPNDLQVARLGVSVSVKHGNAVRRNRIKRVLRAAFRQCRRLLPDGCDYILIPQKGVASYTTASICKTLIAVAARITARAQKVAVCHEKYSP
ncbi:MAG: ribonuclease P protein component [Planctomycetota bacterium]